MSIEQWFSYLIPLDTVGRLVTAIVAGAVIGWEREHHKKPAGLRTHMLVALGAATFIVVTLELLQTLDPDSTNRLDPTRVIEGIIGGVGFLGAGSIIQSRRSVEGITTAASIWISAALGTAAGLGMYRITFLCVVLSMVILLVVGILEHRLMNDRPDNDARSQDRRAGEQTVSPDHAS